MLLENLFSAEQIEVLLASIIGDGEITKPYKNSRRINLNYREHTGVKQIPYRLWKQKFFSEFLHFSYKTNTLYSKSHPAITELFPQIYDTNGNKHIPFNIIKKYCSPLFLAVLYMDDGSLIISKRINHRLKKIYILPTIALYLQCYLKEELENLAEIIYEQYSIKFILQSRKDGNGFILKLNITKDVLRFLKLIQQASESCECMYYKTNWTYRFIQEVQAFNELYPTYKVIASSSNRMKNYSKQEIEKIIFLKQSGYTDQQIASEMGRTYWSIVYKLSELRKKGHLI